MAPRVVLAGHNLDRGLLLQIRALLEELGRTEDPAALGPWRARVRELLARDNWTPETLSAAYARVSRDPRSVTELRRIACEEVDRARRSNETIIFGLGHASVAEHAVFNFDVLGLSRLATEVLEHTRLASYTEKSQRYIFLDEDWVLPEETRGTVAEACLRERAAEQGRFYREAYAALLRRALERERSPAGEADRAVRRRLEGAAKEDARYALSLCASVQLGLTVNARALEGMLARLRAHPLREAQALAEELAAAVGGLAPSLIKYTEPTPYEREAGASLRRAAIELTETARPRPEAARLPAPGPPGASPEEAAIWADPTPECHVALVSTTPDPDGTLAAILLFSAGCGPMAECARRAAALGSADRRRLLLSHLERLGPHDPVLREYEHVEATFELAVSASCFAQLKRHRMATLTALPYDPALGVTVPPSLVEAGLEKAFRSLAARAEECAARIASIAGIAPEVAAYALTNGHRRRVLVRMNARELYHLARLREDAHAQWDIRRVAARMLSLARERMPLTLALAAGKDRFEEVRKALGLGP